MEDVLQDDMDLDVFGYLETLPAASLDRLYGKPAKGSSGSPGTHGPWTCLAVLQSLPQLAKQHVMRLMCVEQYVTRKMLLSWVDQPYINLHTIALNKLLQLRVLAEDPSDSEKLRLNPPFRENLKGALVSPYSAPWRDLSLKPDKTPPSVARIVQDMHRKWEAVLHYLVGSDFRELPDIVEPSPSVVQFVQDTGLMQTDPDGQLGITGRGYEFLLKDIHVQAWMFVQQLLRDCPSDTHREGLLAFMFQLSYCKVGDDYPLEALTGEQREWATELISLGLLFQRKAKSTRFYPSPVAVNLIFGASHRGGPARSLAQHTQGADVPEAPGEALVGSAKISIIVETNYQVVAYTSSGLHQAMLSLFVELRCRLPNAVIGSITRESIRRALSANIKARQILDFLRWHAHPNVSARTPVVPENVADQILLWERERSRVGYQAGVLLDVSRATREKFAGICAYARDLHSCLWSGERGDRRYIVVTPAAHPRVLDFANKNMR